MLPNVSIFGFCVLHSTARYTNNTEGRWHDQSHETWCDILSRVAGNYRLVVTGLLRMYPADGPYSEYECLPLTPYTFVPQSSVHMHEGQFFMFSTGNCGRWVSQEKITLSQESGTVRAFRVCGHSTVDTADLIDSVALLSEEPNHNLPLPLRIQDTVKRKLVGAGACFVAPSSFILHTSDPTSSEHRLRLFVVWVRHSAYLVWTTEPDRLLQSVADSNNRQFDRGIKPWATAVEVPLTSYSSPNHDDTYLIDISRLHRRIRERMCVDTAMKRRAIPWAMSDVIGMIVQTCTKNVASKIRMRSEFADYRKAQEMLL